jgi:hypothetical protein
MDKEKREDRVERYRKELGIVGERSEETKKKVIKGYFSDERIKKLTDSMREKLYEEAAELQLSYSTIIGILEVIKHELQHEILTIDADQTEWR